LKDEGFVMREIVLDTETTGLDPKEGHRVLEIGAIEIAHQATTGRVFHRLINPERDVPEEAVRVHGHTADKLKGEPVFAALVEEFLEFVGDGQLVIHNAEFDMRFLNAELQRLGREPIGMERVVDTLALARKKHPGQSNTLDALCDRYRIDRTRRVKHGALLDAEILVEIYAELTGGRQRSLSLDVWGDSAGPAVDRVRQRLEPRPPRRARLSAEEEAAHRAHVATLGEAAVWRLYVAALDAPATE
jgi:DNA polymerase-3 subunit epsilon